MVRICRNQYRSSDWERGYLRQLTGPPFGSGDPRRFSFRARALRIRAMESTKASLQKIAPGIHAWMQPTTGWSRNNAGLVAGDESALIVDTLFDLPLTRTMLDAMRAA